MLTVTPNSSACLRADIAGYLDGELTPGAEESLEMHFARCGGCAAELNAQKSLLHALDVVFNSEAQIALPEDFARVVSIKAESNVIGLRSPEGRKAALMVCPALLIVALMLLGAERATVFNVVGTAAGQLFVVGSFVGHLAYDVSFGLAVILHSAADRVGAGAAFPAVVFVIILALVIAKLLRPERISS
jgi:anti-sigma factor RsiW